MMLHPQTFERKNQIRFRTNITRRNETYAVDAPVQPADSPNQIARLYVIRCNLGGYLKAL